MTKKELHTLIDEFIEGQPDDDKDDWYCTTKEATETVMELFRDFLEAKKSRKRRS